MKPQDKPCIICENPITEKGNHSVTCCSSCAKIYNRVYRHISKTMRKNISEKFLAYWNSLK